MFLRKKRGTTYARKMRLLKDTVHNVKIEHTVYSINTTPIQLKTSTSIQEYNHLKKTYTPMLIYTNKAVLIPPCQII